MPLQDTDPTPSFGGFGLKYRRRVGRDNTVKYRWRTLQLLPDRGRPSYAGSVMMCSKDWTDDSQCNTKGV